MTKSTVSQNQSFHLLEVEYTINGLPNNPNEIRQIMYNKYGADLDIDLIELWLYPTLDEIIDDKISIVNALGIYY